MIKKILDWILGKSDNQAQPKELTADQADQLNKEMSEHLPKQEPSKGKETTDQVNPVTVKAKYKRADLEKMTKKVLAELAAKHQLEVKSRATKSELISLLVKV